MICRFVERWLDRGMPEKERESAMRHIPVCGACFEAFEAASGLEAALRAEATARALPVVSAAAVSADFVENVMTRVAAAQSLAQPSRTARRRGRAWVELVTDPISMISVTTAVVVAVAGFWHPEWFLEAGIRLVGAWLSVASFTPASPVELAPIVWIAIATAACPLAIWAVWTLYRRLERTLLLLTARPGA